MSWHLKTSLIPIAALLFCSVAVSSLSGLWGVYFEREWWMFFIPYGIGFVLGFMLGAAFFIGKTKEARND